MAHGCIPTRAWCGVPGAPGAPLRPGSPTYWHQGNGKGQGAERQLATRRIGVQGEEEESRRSTLAGLALEPPLHRLRPMSRYGQDRMTARICQGMALCPFPDSWMWGEGDHQVRSRTRSRIDPPVFSSAPFPGHEPVSTSERRSRPCPRCSWPGSGSPASQGSAPPGRRPSARGAGGRGTSFPGPGRP